MTSNDTIKVEIIAAVANAISGLENVAQKVLSGVVAWQTYKKIIVESVQEYMNAEKAAVALGNAFRIQGQYSSQTMESLRRVAEQLQKTTIYEDDATISAMAMLKQLTTLDRDGIAKLIPHVQDFASAMGLDLQQAATLVAKTIGSDTNALSRYGIEVKGTMSEGEKLTAIVGELDKKFGGLAVTVGQTAYGSMEKMKNQMSDVGESIGGVFVKVSQTSLSTWGLAWQNFWDMVLLRGSGEGTAAFDYLFRATVEYTAYQAKMAAAVEATTVSLHLQYQKMREMASDPAMVSIIKILGSEAWKNLGVWDFSGGKVAAEKTSRGTGDAMSRYKYKLRFPFEGGGGDLADIGDGRGSSTPFDFTTVISSASEYNAQLDQISAAIEVANWKLMEMNHLSQLTDKAFKDLGDEMLRMVSTEMVKGLYDIGYALNSGGDAGDAVRNTIQSIIRNIPTMLLNAGLMQLGLGNPAGWALLAASGLAAFLGGGINAAIDDQYGFGSAYREGIGASGPRAASTPSVGGYTVIVQGNLWSAGDLATELGRALR